MLAQSYSRYAGPGLRLERKTTAGIGAVKEYKWPGPSGEMTFKWIGTRMGGPDAEMARPASLLFTLLSLAFRIESSRRSSVGRAVDS